MRGCSSGGGRGAGAGGCRWGKGSGVGPVSWLRGKEACGAGRRTLLLGGAVQRLSNVAHLAPAEPKANTAFSDTKGEKWDKRQLRNFSWFATSEWLEWDESVPALGFPHRVEPPMPFILLKGTGVNRVLVSLVSSCRNVNVTVLGVILSICSLRFPSGWCFSAASSL